MTETYPASSDGFKLDTSPVSRKKAATSLSIAERVLMVGIKPRLTDTGMIEYSVYIEYKPDARFSKATLEGKITLAGIVDSTEYVVKDGSGAWEVSYEERWKGDYTVSTIDDATDDEKNVTFDVIYYTNPLTAIHNLMASDPASFFNMDQDDLGNILEEPFIAFKSKI